jgi:MerR family transcriptional regulator, redox-sensitive transcriptional activator SoxR
MPQSENESDVATEFTIGEVERISGVPATTLRFYERSGLIRPPARRSGQRRYDAEIFSTLMVIRFCRIAGLSLDEIAVVLEDRSDGRSETKRIALDHAERIDVQLAQLRLARSMMHAVAACVCPTVEECECGAMEPVLRRLRRLTPAFD